MFSAARHRDALIKNAEAPEILVPIKIDIELDEFYRLRESFSWNLNGTLFILFLPSLYEISINLVLWVDSVTEPSHFASLLCDDLDLSRESFVEKIALQIQKQIDEWTLAYSFLLSQGQSVFESIREMSGGEVRVIVKLELNLGNVELKDRFEWDLCTCPTFGRSRMTNSAGVTPETFAHVLCQDLGLGGEWVNVISTRYLPRLYIL